MSLVDPTRPDPAAVTPGPSRSTVVVSLALHVLVVVALVVVPLFGHVLLPAASVSGASAIFVRAAAIPEIPAPPSSSASSAPSTSPTSAPTVATAAAAPTEAPDGISEASAPIPSLPDAVRGGSLASGLSGVDGGLPDAPALHAPPPPVVAPPAAPLRVGGDIKAPHKLRHVAPLYPSIAAQARVSGTVILEATIAPTGDVINVRVLRSVPLLDMAAVDAVRQWRYEPPTLNGTPIAVLLTVTVRFAN